MHIYIDIYIYLHSHIHIHKHIHMHMHMHMHMHTYIHIYIYTYIHIYIYTYIHIYIYTYIHIYIYTYIHIYIYIYIHIYIYTYIYTYIYIYYIHIYIIYIYTYIYMNIINNSSGPRKGGQAIYHNVKHVVSFLVLLPDSVAAWPQRSVFAIRTLRIRSKGAPLLPLKSVRSSYMDCDFLRQSWNGAFFLYGHPQIINFFMGCSIVNHLILGFSIINHPFPGDPPVYGNLHGPYHTVPDILSPSPRCPGTLWPSRCQNCTGHCLVPRALAKNMMLNWDSTGHMVVIL